MPIPPLNEQRGISKLMAALDHRVTLLRETNATLEAIAQALFKSWFVDFDPVRAKMQGRAPPRHGRGHGGAVSGWDGGIGVGDGAEGVAGCSAC